MSNQEITIEMAIETTLQPAMTHDGSAVAFRTRSGSPVLRYCELHTYGADGTILSSTMTLSGDGRAILISIDAKGAEYPITVDPLLTYELMKLTASDGEAVDHFGEAVSVSGDTVIIGAMYDDQLMQTRQGSAYIFMRNQGGADAWGEVKKLTAGDGEAYDYFGGSVAIDGDIAVVGAYGDDIGANAHQGSAYIFQRNHGGADNWGEVAKLTAPDGSQVDSFGNAVAISGNTVVIGALGDDVGSNEDQGSAWIFERNRGGTDMWGVVGNLTDPRGGEGDKFGCSVSISGDHIVVGARHADVDVVMEQGTALVFRRNEGGADNWGLVTRLAASDGSRQDWFGWSVSIDTDTIVAGAPAVDVGNQGGRGAAYVFGRNVGGGDVWGEVAKLESTDSHDDAWFGISVSICDDMAIVGAYRDNVSGNRGQGSSYLFSRNMGGADRWGKLRYLTASDGSVDDYMGLSVCLSGSTAIVGVFGDDIGNNEYQGSAYIFSIWGNTWEEGPTLRAQDGARDDVLGYAIAVDDDTVVVSAWSDDVGNNEDQGSAYIFERNRCGADGWGLVRKITASDGERGDSFGSAVSIDQDTIIVGARQDTTGANTYQGSAYIFERNEGGTDNWGEVVKLTASDGAIYDYFGWSIAICGDTAIVGSPSHDTGGNERQGAAYIFTRNQGGADNWGQMKKLISSGGAANDYFGHSVAIDGDTAVVGATGVDVSGNEDQGSAYVFTRNEGGADSWGQEKQLVSSDGEGYDSFGCSVAVDTAIIVVGALYDDVGTNRDQGSTYVFTRNEGGADRWGQVKKLTASGGEEGDRLGSSVSVNDDTVVAGASWADPGGNDLQGSVYVFRRNGGGADNWGEMQNVTGSSGAMGDMFGSSVSISGRILVVGVPGDEYGTSTDQGSARVFKLTYANTLPSITAEDVIYAEEDVSLQVVLRAFDPDPADTLIWYISFTDTDGWLRLDNLTGNLSGTPDNTDVGLWTLNVTVDDGNGGVDFHNLTLVVNNTKPHIITADIETIDEDQFYHVDYASDDDDQGTVTWHLATSAGWLDMDPGTGELQGTPADTDVGNHWVNVSVDDGNDGVDWSNFTLTVVNVNDPPAIATTSLADALEDVYYLHLMNVSDVDLDHGDALQWSMRTNAGFLSIEGSSGALSGLPANDDVGLWWVNISVSDLGGATASTNLTIMVVNAPPRILTEDVVLVNQDENLLVDYNSDDDGQGVVTWSLDTRTGWLTMDPATGVLSGTPRNADVGEHTVNVSVDDGNGGVGWSRFTLTVRNVNDPPKIAPMGPLEFKQGDSVSVRIVVEDPDLDIPVGETISFTCTGADAFKPDANGWVNLTPDQSLVGEHDVVYIVTDAGGLVASLAVRWTIDDVNDAPVIITIVESPVHAFEDTEFVLDLVAEDLDGDTITWSDDSPLFDIGPDGHIAFTPLQLDVGRTTVTITASDGRGSETNLTFDLVVLGMNDPPVIHSILPPEGTRYNEGTTVTFRANVSDEDDVDLTCIWMKGGEELGRGTLLEYSKLPPGKHTIKLAVTDGEHTVEGTTVVIVQASEGLDAFTLLLIVIVVVLVLVGLIVFLRRRRNLEDNQIERMDDA